MGTITLRSPVMWLHTISTSVIDDRLLYIELDHSDDRCDTRLCTIYYYEHVRLVFFNYIGRFSKFRLDEMRSNAQKRFLPPGNGRQIVIYLVFFF